MTDTSKLEYYHSRVTDDTIPESEKRTALDYIETTYETRHIYKEYVYSVIKQRNSDLCLRTVFSNEDAEGTIKALDFWGIDEFVYYASNNRSFAQIYALCKAGWTIAGACMITSDDEKVAGIKLIKL